MKLRHIVEELHQNDARLLGQHRYEVIDRQAVGDYGIFLIRSPAFDAMFGSAYQVALNRDGASFTTPDAQRKRLPYAGQLGQGKVVERLVEALRNWREKYGRLLFSSYNPKKINVYAQILRRAGFNVERLAGGGFGDVTDILAIE
jgi:hypothetical protein